MLSTDWNELLVPFSALIRDVKFPCEGFRITVDAEGNIVELQKIEPLKEAHLLDFIPHHMIYCFSSKTSRELRIPILKEKIEQHGITDFVIFSLNYAGQNERVVAPFALYICMGTVSLERAKEIFLSLGVTDEVQEYLENTDENEFDFFQHQVHEQVFGTFSIDCDDFGIGYPEKAGQLANEWMLSDANRFGRWNGSEKIYSDGELWGQISAFGGKNVLVFKKQTSPRFTAAWQECKTQAENALIGYSPWAKIYGLYLDEIEKKHPTASVDVSIFNPVDLLLQLYSCIAKQQLAYLPHLQIKVEDSDKPYKSIAISSWIWDGTTKPHNPKKFLTEIFGEPFAYLTYRHMGMLDQYYDRILEIHGFSMPIVEIQEINGQESARFELKIKSKSLVRHPLPIGQPPGCSMIEFFDANQKYMQELVEFVEEYTVGLD